MNHLSGIGWRLSDLERWRGRYPGAELYCFGTTISVLMFCDPPWPGVPTDSQGRQVFHESFDAGNLPTEVVRSRLDHIWHTWSNYFCRVGLDPLPEIQDEPHP